MLVRAEVRLVPGGLWEDILLVLPQPMPGKPADWRQAERIAALAENLDEALTSGRNHLARIGATVNAPVLRTEARQDGARQWTLSAYTVLEGAATDRLGATHLHSAIIVRAAPPPAWAEKPGAWESECARLGLPIYAWVVTTAATVGDEAPAVRRGEARTLGEAEADVVAIVMAKAPARSESGPALWPRVFADLRKIA
ncbi:hypothetical protein [Belnapia rosea]|uniref:hypothetical protein n=1 Tax=Belnapia rosea TaxID=938405 RepID=UPI00115FCC20|nr:hypothetical protein [Belnapia rosea]